MNKTKLKAALVGCGAIGSLHSKVIEKQQNASYVGCCDEKFPRAQAFAEQFHTRPYATLKEMLSAENPDVLHVCTGHYSHVPLTLYALKNRTHVILEKPAASNMEELELLTTYSAQSDYQVGVCFQNRYNPASKKAYELITSGEAGKVICSRGIVTWIRKEPYYTENDWRGAKNTEGGGVMINQAIHTLDLMHYLLGDPLTVEASTSNRSLRGVINVEDTAEARFVFENGVTGLFYATTAYGVDEAVMLDVVCENMRIRIEGDELIIRYPDGTVSKPDVTTESETFGKSYWGNGHEAFIKDFYRCVIEKEKFWIDADEGCRSLRTLFRMFESAEMRS